MLSIYVLANGDLFREALNAIVTLLGTGTFDTAMRIALVFSIYGAIAQYIQGRDLISFAKWFGFYVLTLAVLLGPKCSVQVIDITDPGRADLTVDHVPYGLAMPAHLISLVGYALAQTVDDAFSMPDELAYTQTGMLFGSQFFRMSTGMAITDPKLAANMNNYIKSCVIGDIMMNHKYSFADVLEASDIWAVISQRPSPLRGMYIDHHFYTCQQATPMLHDALQQEASTNAPNYYATRFLGDDNPDLKAQFAQYLTGSYHYFTGLAQSATQIVEQNLMMNAWRSGIGNYIASTNNAAALQNYASTTAMEKMRLAWNTSHHMALTIVPLLQVVLKLLFYCLFPYVVLMALQPRLALFTIKHYIYALIWVESWPLFYSVLNFVMSFYLHSHTSGLSASGLTLVNANPLAQEHSDIAGIAGYLTLDR